MISEETKKQIKEIVDRLKIKFILTLEEEYFENRL